jgi:hypothetical protein
MKDWDIWAWIAYGTIATAAICLAVDSAIKMSPALLPKFSWLLENSIWGFVPFILVIVGTILFISNQLGVLSFRTNIENSGFEKWPEPYNPPIISGQRFSNQEVVLDNFLYVNCVFENVTFKYNGTTAVQMRDNRVVGRVNFSSDNIAVIGTAFMLQGLGVTKTPFDVITSGRVPTVDMPMFKQ